MTTKTECMTCGNVTTNTNGSPWNSSVVWCANCKPAEETTAPDPRFPAILDAWQEVVAVRALRDLGQNADTRARAVKNLPAAEQKFHSLINALTWVELERFADYRADVLGLR